MIVRARTEINEVLIRELLAGKIVNQPTPPSFFFFNSGCASLRFFLQLIGNGKRVGIQVYTCSTVLDVITSEGCTPVFMDINPDYYTTTLEYVEDKIDDMDVLVLTHLFGIPNPDYLEIKKLCSEHKVILLDDLCQTFHAKVENDYLEDMSENYFYSFFYDKPISSVRGGMLKVSDTYKEDARQKFERIPQVDDAEGRKNLKVLLLMHKLLAPEKYNKEFRCGAAWKQILSIWPISWSLNVLNYLVNSKWIVLFNKIIRFKNKNEEVASMSNVEKTYILLMMQAYHNNNHLLIDFFNSNEMELPKYLKNKSIVCTVAKRAIIGHDVVSEDVQVGLYNWPELICDRSDYSKYPNSASILKSHTNIPCWTKGTYQLQ